MTRLLVASPELQAPQSPQGIGAVSTTLPMLVEPGPRSVEIDQPAQLGRRAQGFFLEAISKKTSKPGPDRRCEAVLGQVQVLRWQATAAQLPQKVLRIEPGQLRSRRNPKGVLGDSVIEQWRPNLEAVLHAHAIHLHQHIVRQIDLEIGVLGLL